MMVLKNLPSPLATDTYSLSLNMFVIFKHKNRIHFVIVPSLWRSQDLYFFLDI